MFSASNHDSDLYEEPPPSPMPEDIAPMPEEQRESVSALLSHADQSARSVGDPEEHEALPDRATDDGPFVALESRREKYAKIVVAHWGKKWHRSLRAQKIISKKVGHAGLSVTVIKHLAIMAFWIPPSVGTIDPRALPANLVLHEQKTRQHALYMWSAETRRFAS